MDNNFNGTYNGSALLPIGTVLHERYEVTGVLGVGGFGVTYSANDNVLQTQVAVKEYFPGTIVSRQQDGLTNC